MVGGDNTAYALPNYLYFSFGSLSAIEVRNLAIHALSIIQIECNVVTLAFRQEEVAWKLGKMLPKLPVLGVTLVAQDDVKQPDPSELLTKIEQTMDKVRPLAETTAKITSEFGQILIKGCTTLNAGALVAVPAFFKALSRRDASPEAIYLACEWFAGGLAAGAFAGWVAFVFSSQVSRLLSRSLQMPLLKAQQVLYPETMDKIQLKRLSKAEFSMKWQELVSTIGLWTISLVCFASVACLIIGAYQAALATLH